MERIRRLYWDPQYTMHDETIDLQHQKLYKITNDLIDRYESGSSDCYDAIKNLVDYAAENFQSEQVVMMKSEYPDFQRHLKEHEFFVAKLKEFVEGYKNSKENLTLEMVNFLREWLSFHTIRYDVELGDHLLKTSGPKGLISED